MRDYIHVLVIGDTGAGKSSLIKLITGDDSIQVSDEKNSQSCTKEINGYQYCACNYKQEKTDKAHKNNYNVLKLSKIFYFYDTMGTQDTDDDKSDETVLNEIQGKIYMNNGENIKIIWCVKPNDKRTPSLQKQAKFINKPIVRPNCPFFHDGHSWTRPFVCRQRHQIYNHQGQIRLFAIRIRTIVVIYYIIS